MKDVASMTAVDWVMQRNRMDLADLRLQAAKELKELAERATRAATSFESGDDSPWDLHFIRGQADEVHSTVSKLATLKEFDKAMRQAMEHDAQKAVDRKVESECRCSMVTGVCDACRQRANGSAQ